MGIEVGDRTGDTLTVHNVTLQARVSIGAPSLFTSFTVFARLKDLVLDIGQACRLTGTVLADTALALDEMEAQSLFQSLWDRGFRPTEPKADFEPKVYTDPQSLEKLAERRVAELIAMRDTPAPERERPMSAAKPGHGFYGNDSDLIYVTRSGRIWLVDRPDEGPDVLRELAALPAGVESWQTIYTPDFEQQHLARIQAAGGATYMDWPPQI